MGKNKKKFINKKEAVSFHLVHRSQRDPLQADNDASQRVLHPVNNIQDSQSRLDQATGLSSKEENAKYGIFFDDDYDYMQHLRERGEGVLVMDDTGVSRQTEMPRESNSSKEVDLRIKLPTEVLASEYEEDEGMLSKGLLPRGPKPDWDPDIVACLDDALDLDDPDNILEDNFILMANAEGRGYDRNDAEEGERDYGSDDFSYSGDEDSDFGFSSDEDESQGTRYSMTSSVIRRTQELKILDDRFDKILEEYEDDEIGGLDNEEITGYVKADERLGDRFMGEMLHACPKTLQELQGGGSEKEKSSLNDKITGDDSDSGDEKLERFVEREKLQWDCESILSTHSTLYNHPKLISEPKDKKAIQLTKKHGIPIGVLKNKKDETHGVEVVKNEIVDNTRDKNESKEEKRLRKQAVKEERRKRRVERKTTKELFKSEHVKQEKVLANAKVQQGLKI